MCLMSGVQGITDLITTPGLINLDFADVKSVMQGAGTALMGIGSARGDDRATAAAETAISSPLLEASIDGARGVLLSISGGSDLGLFEINESARHGRRVRASRGKHHFWCRHRRCTGRRGARHRHRGWLRWWPTGTSASGPAQSSRRTSGRQTSKQVVEPVRTKAASADEPDQRIELPEPKAPRTIVFDDSASDDLDVPDFLK